MSLEARGAIAVAVAAVVVACTASDPLIGLEPGDGTDAGADGGAPADAGEADGGEGSDAGPPVGCPSTTPTACAAANIPFGSPALHIDTCGAEAPSADGFVTGWPIAVAGTTATAPGAPGALFCRNALAGKPGLVFDKGGFTIPAALIPAADTPNGDFAIVAVLQYTPSNHPDTVAGGVVFERTKVDYPFEGPSLVTNFAFMAPGTDVNALMPTTRVAGAMRFGQEGSSGAPGYAIASTTPGSVDKPFVAVVNFAGNQLALYVDGVAMTGAAVPGGYPLTNGNGIELRIGHGQRPGKFLVGTLSELVYYPRVLSAAELAPITAGLKTKWSITP